MVTVAVFHTVLCRNWDAFQATVEQISANWGHDACVMGGETRMRWRDGLCWGDLMAPERGDLAMLTTAAAEPMTVAERVKQLRKDHGLTQEDLAAKAGLGIATIQRVEGGAPPSSATIASIAAAFGLSPVALTSASKPASAEPTNGSYLPLAEITSGKRLVDLMAASAAIDFDYMEIHDGTIGDLLGRLYEFCRPREDFQVPTNPSERIRLDIEASKLLAELRARGLTLSGETFVRTGHEVDDDGEAFPLLLAKWDETCLVLRVGTGGLVVDRAEVEARLPKWYNTSDPRIVQEKAPHTPRTSDDEIPF
jgi:transcriptional regulator with XRE-family HTH domain